MFAKLLGKLPLGESGQALVGTAIVCAICAIPMINRKTKPGHGLFDSEKPQEIEQAQDAQRKATLGV
ncbi:hypothetical protein JKP88DRAFT_231909 [Tribonema minus]|uniref:Uncharacterized protein n=1 Tax=Tribonema minus TaxID=303371 RepID=A0A835ZBU4_9STRA|nr:hypothetical protein JKP88DRAFT_231909 [Tribonema minus]